jgi:virginiamycin B lyase
MRRWCIAIVGIGIWMLGGASIGRAADIPEVKLDEWEVPWDRSRPRDPFAHSEDAVWFVGQRGNYVAMLNPQDGTFKKYDLPDKALPHNLIVDSEGVVWYAGNGDAHIGRIDPATGEVTRIDMPDKAARDPHTLIFDADENIWFTVQGGNFVGHLNTDTRDVRLIEVPTRGARPYGIKLDSRGRPWVVEFGSYKLALIDPETFTLKEIDLPRKDARPRRIAITSDDMVWYVDYADGYLGRYNPRNGMFDEWRAPGGSGAKPYGLEVDDEDRLWFVEFGSDPARFVGFDAKKEDFIGVTEIPSGGGVRHMHYYQPTQTIWFGTDSNTIGRIEVPVSPRLTN